VLWFGLAYSLAFRRHPMGALDPAALNASAAGLDIWAAAVGWR
jgi:hypothetical protein